MVRKKRTKTEKPSTLGYPSSKSYISAGYSEMPFGMTPSEDKYYDDLAVDMINEIRNDPEIFDIDEWLEKKGIYYRMFMIMKDRNKNLEIAYDVARKSIGFRMAKLLRKTSPGSIAFVMPQYHDAWRDEVDRRAANKAKLENKGETTVIVQMDSVKKIKKDKEKRED